MLVNHYALEKTQLSIRDIIGEIEQYNEIRNLTKEYEMKALTDELEVIHIYKTCLTESIDQMAEKSLEM